MHGPKDTPGALPESKTLRSSQESHDVRSTIPQRAEEPIEEPCRCLSCTRITPDRTSQAKPAKSAKKQQLAWEVDLGQKQRHPTRPADSRRPATARKPVCQWDDASIAVSLDSEPDATASSQAMTYAKTADEKFLQQENDAAGHSDTEAELELSGMLSDCSLSDIDSDGSTHQDDANFCPVPAMTAKVNSLPALKSIAIIVKRSALLQGASLSVLFLQCSLLIMVEFICMVKAYVANTWASACWCPVNVSWCAADAAGRKRKETFG